MGPAEISGVTVAPLGMALHKYARSYLTTALEATLSGTDKMDVVFRIRSRAAALLATSTDRASVIFDDVGVLYDLRSKLIHGATLTEKDFEKQIRKLNPEERMPTPATSRHRVVSGLTT